MKTTFTTCHHSVQAPVDRKSVEEAVLTGLFQDATAYERLAGALKPEMFSGFRQALFSAIIAAFATTAKIKPSTVGTFLPQDTPDGTPSTAFLAAMLANNDDVGRPDDYIESLVELHQTPIASDDKTKTSWFSATELQKETFPEVKYIVPEYIAEGLTLLAGKPKRGKSWLCLHAAIAVATGGDTLGNKCDQGDVLYCALEDNNRRLQRRMDKLVGLGQWPQRLAFVCEMPRLNNGGIDVVRKWIEQADKPRLVIIDTLARVRDARGREQSNYESDYAAVADLKALADAHGIAIVIVHHQRKMDAEDPLDSVSGTTGLTGAVDSVIVLMNDSSGVRLYGRGRDIEEIDTVVEFDAAACVWNVIGPASEVRRTVQRTDVIALLLDAQQPMGPAEIAKALDKPAEAIRQLLPRMVTAGEIRKLEYGRYTVLPVTPGTASH